MPHVLGYYPQWVSDNVLPPERVDYRLFTHLCHAFAVPVEDGSVPANTEKAGAALCANGRQAGGVRVLLSLGGADTGKRLAAVASDPAKRARLLDGLAGQVARCGYAGVDVDWEFPESAAERDLLSGFVRDLRARLGKDALIGMAVPAGDWYGRWFDSAALLPHVDLLNVMTYDLHGPWSARAGHNAPLSYLADALTYWTKQKNCPREKVLLGIPCYGRGFAVRRWGDAQDKQKKPAHPYVGLRDVEALRAAGWKQERDREAGVPYLAAPDGSELISYEDEASAKAKGRWAREEKAGGVFFWEISQDFEGGTHRIVKAARG